MLGAGPGGFIVFFTYKALFLLVTCTHDLDAVCQSLQFGREGGNTVLSPGSVTENLTSAEWRYNKDVKIADKRFDLTGHQFSGRVTLNKTNYNLEVKELKTTDSGNFTFVSSTNTGQRPTECIRLVVQEVLTQQPTVTENNITMNSNGSCVVQMECSSKFDKDVMYRWKVNNVEYNGPLLQYPLTQEGDITFTCIVFNMISEKSENRTINCQSSGLKSVVLLVTVGCIGCIIIVTIIGLVVYCRHRKTKTELNNELSVYAEIDDVSSGKITKPCSLYDSLDAKHSTQQSKPQTVYDQIQFSRMQQ
ncbi:uncharacterized protein LOC117386703 [Periophthalmus magnuspinnatus]|uniref:uncharacterized protein LOC117386703 n=1 Tax=Periophthalmus magnuspinnatus TaxID=409849 RepID=UPI0024364628|nr:uncharacterized protein LOC117386703 [Periophthalmus magnuspinnatus]